MPWWAWLIIGVVAVGFVFGTIVFTYASAIIRDIWHDLRKGWDL